MSLPPEPRAGRPANAHLYRIVRRLIQVDRQVGYLISKPGDSGVRGACRDGRRAARGTRGGIIERIEIFRSSLFCLRHLRLLMKT